MEQKNGTKNVTIAEIARRAGVSSATVSYVISDRQDVKIAKSTRERILTICKELGYQKFFVIAGMLMQPNTLFIFLHFSFYSILLIIQFFLFPPS